MCLEEGVHWEDKRLVLFSERRGDLGLAFIMGINPGSDESVRERPNGRVAVCMTAPT